MSAFFARSEVVERGLGDFLVDRLHPLLAERAGGLDLLRAVGVGPGVDHAARRIPLDQLRILEVVGILELFLGVEVVERAHELVEAVRGGQVLVEVAEVVLAELRGHVALRLEQLREGDVARLEPLLRARQADLEVAGAEAALPGDERGASGGAALLAVPVGEQRAFLGDAVDVGRLVAHHALVVGADIPVADVVAPDDEDVGLLVRRGCRAGDARQTDNNGAERSHQLRSHSSLLAGVMPCAQVRRKISVKRCAAGAPSSAFRLRSSCSTPVVISASPRSSRSCAETISRSE